MSKASENQRRLARALGLSVDQLRALRNQLRIAESDLTSTPKSGRAALVARRLSITPGELKLLRQALAGNAIAQPAAVQLLAERILGLRALRGTLEPAKTKTKTRNRTRRSPGPAAPRSPGGARPNLFDRWNADTNVFITSWGNAIHLYADCHGTRGFRHAGEPDPVVHPVPLRDPVCHDRRACRKCFDHWSPSTIDRLDTLLEDLHGKRRPASAKAPRPKAKPPACSQAARPKRTAKQSKAEKAAAKAKRDKAEAARLGITVDELRARRRAEHEANKRKKGGG